MRNPYRLGCLLAVYAAVLASAGASAQSSCSAQAQTSWVPEPPGTLLSVPYVPETLDELFADCHVDDWPGATWHAICGQFGLHGANTFVLDHEGGEQAYDPTRVKTAAEKLRAEGQTVEEGTLSYEGEWPVLLLIETCERGRKVTGANVYHLPGTQGGQRWLACRDPLGRCEAIVQRAVTRDYQHTAVFPPKAPAEANLERQRLEEFLNRCEVMGQRFGTLIANCDDPRISMVWISGVKTGPRGFSEAEQREQLLDFLPEDAVASDATFSWEGRELIAQLGHTVEDDGERQGLLAVASPRNARWIDRFYCHGSTDDCDALLRRMLAERPPYANVRDAGPAMMAAFDAGELVFWILVTLFGLLNVAAIGVLVSGLRATVLQLVTARARIAVRIPLVIVAVLIPSVLGVFAYATYLGAPFIGDLWTLGGLLEFFAGLAIMWFVIAILPITAALILRRRARRLGETQPQAPASAR